MPDVKNEHCWLFQSTANADKMNATRYMFMMNMIYSQPIERTSIFSVFELLGHIVSRGDQIPNLHAFLNESV